VTLAVEHGDAEGGQVNAGSEGKLSRTGSGNAKQERQNRERGQVTHPVILPDPSEWHREIRGGQWTV